MMKKSLLVLALASTLVTSSTFAFGLDNTYNSNYIEDDIITDAPDREDKLEIAPSPKNNENDTNINKESFPQNDTKSKIIEKNSKDIDKESNDKKNNIENNQAPNNNIKKQDEKNTKSPKESDVKEKKPSENQNSIEKKNEIKKEENSKTKQNKVEEKNSNEQNKSKFKLFKKENNNNNCDTENKN